MEPQEFETKLQNALGKYGQLIMEDDREVPVSGKDDTEEIRQILNEAVEAMRNDANKALIVSESFKRLPNLNSLIYSTLFEPDEVSILGFPLQVMQVILKENFESRTELIKSVGHGYLSHEVCEFCDAFPRLELLCSTPWKELNAKMDEMLVSDEEKRDVMACLWSQHSAFRKALCENNFAGESIDELESKGARYFEKFSKHERLELKQRYKLTATQLDILDAWAAKVPSLENASSNKTNGSNLQLERQRFIELISKAKDDLTLIASGCRSQSTELDELCGNLNWDKNLLTKSSVIQPMKFMLDQAIRILELNNKPTNESRRSEDLIADVDNGSALYGLCFGFKKDDWCYKAHSPLVLRPDVCKLTETTGESVMSKNFCFSDKDEARNFEKAVLETGLSAAESFAKQYISCFETNLSGYCKSVIILSFRSYPMASFRLEGRHLNLTPQAEVKLEDIHDNNSAAAFLENHGSHIPRSVQRLGGITCHSVEISLPSEEPKARLRELVHHILDRGVSEFLFLPNSRKIANMDCELSGKTLNVPCSFEVKLRGLQIAQPQLYAEVIKYCSLEQSVLIERSVAESSLDGIWNWIVDKNPSMSQQAEFLRNAWLRKAKRCETVQLVASELQKLSERNSDELSKNDQISSVEKESIRNTSAAVPHHQEEPVVIQRKFYPHDPRRIQRAKQSAMRAKRVFFDFLIDFPSEMIYDGETSTRRKLMRWLRHRMNLNRSLNETGIDEGVDYFGASDASTANNSVSHYETLCELIDEYDPNGICEMYQLLLESRYTLPLFNPLTGEHYLKLLRDVCVPIAPSKPPVCLGDDVKMLRVALISCREPDESQAHEILRNVFFVNTLMHANDLADGTLIDQALTIDLGIGHIEPKKGNDPSTRAPLAVLIAHVTGDYTSAICFVNEFADVVIVEDVPSSNGALGFCSIISKTGNGLFESVIQVLRWVPTSGRFATFDRDANFKKHGFPHLSVEAPSGDKLFNVIASTLHNMSVDGQRNRRPLHSLELFDAAAGVTYPVKGVVPFDIEQLLEENLKNVVQTRMSFLLQRSFRDQYKYEERKIESRNDESEKKKAEREIEKCEKQRKIDAGRVSELPLLALLLRLLELPNPSVRVMALRKFSQGISARTEMELRQLQEKIDECYKLVTGSVSKGKSETDKRADKEKYVEAKRQYQDAMLHMEHLWRELSHLYVANTNKYRNLPRLAAQHLLDGFSIELLDGDANLLNFKWIDAVFRALQSLIDPERRRIFVLSVMGVQSSGKSTLLNTMFGIKMRTSVGQCTRGINMQLLPVEGRKEYDYMLVLDTEGTRSPDFHGMEGSEKRDNQMATLSILLADATIIVNPGENDAATKEILPIVLMAYQGSKLAEDNGGRLSSMMFFVYNRIDTTQKEKLANIIQTLAQSLMDAFKTVQEMGGSTLCHGTPLETESNNCLFRRFALDASNSSSSDVRILGQNKKSYEPPTNVPDPKYGEALVEFREHVHRRVTQTTDGDGVTWQRRSLIQLSNYIDNVWQCICSADFTLRFAHVVERATFDHLEADYQRCERDLASQYQTEFRELHKSMLRERQSVDSNDSAATSKLSEDFERRLQKAVEEPIVALNGTVEKILSQKGREKWRLSYEQRWSLSKSKQSDHWIRQMKQCFDNIFLFDNKVAMLKSEMRQRIREKFHGITRDRLARLTEQSLESDYDRIINEFTEKANAMYPPLDVKNEIDNFYSDNKTINALQINVFSSEVESECCEIFNHLRTAQDAVRNNIQGTNKPFWYTIKTFFKSSASKEQPHSLSAHYDLCSDIHTEITGLLVGVERYDDVLVSSAIEKTDAILKKTIRGRIQYSQREHGHVYARLAITFYLAEIQKKWERNNSVPARFSEEKNKKEMYQFFQMVLNGTKKISLFRFHLQNKLENLPKAFEAEMMCLISQRVKEQKWLYEIKWTQNYMDRYLLELIDKKQVADLIHYVRNQNELFTVVMRRLIAQIAKDLFTNGKGWREFTDQVKKAIDFATDKALLSKTDRAGTFIHELHTRLIDTLKADALPESIELDLGKEYAILDSERDDDFRKEVGSKLLETIESQYEPSDKEKFSLKVSDLVLKQLRAENQPGAMPRCEAVCPWCKSMCNRKAGHDPEKQKHDAIHQPGGLGSITIRGKNTLDKDICSANSDDARLHPAGDNVGFLFRDWCERFTEWEKPHPTQEWPLREYIFYHYHKDFAKHYHCSPCEDVPESYNRDLSIIRETLEHGPIEF